MGHYGALQSKRERLSERARNDTGIQFSDKWTGRFFLQTGKDPKLLATATRYVSISEKNDVVTCHGFRRSVLGFTGSEDGSKCVQLQCSHQCLPKGKDVAPEGWVFPELTLRDMKRPVRLLKAWKLQPVQAQNFKCIWVCCGANPSTM